MSTASNVAYILRLDEFIFAFTTVGNKILNTTSLKASSETYKGVCVSVLRSLPNLRSGLQTFSGGHCRSFLISWQTLLI